LSIAARWLITKAALACVTHTHTQKNNEMLLSKIRQKDKIQTKAENSEELQSEMEGTIICGKKLIAWTSQIFANKN
jgi:hypothetical protein